MYIRYIGMHRSFNIGVKLDIPICLPIYRASLPYTDVFPVWLPYEGNNYTVCIWPYSQSPCHVWMRCFTLSVLRKCCHLSTVSGRIGFSHSGYNIPYTLPDKLSHRILVFVCYVILWGYLEHIPVHVIKTNLKCGFRLVRPTLNRP